MNLYKKWLSESRYLIIKKQNNPFEILSIEKIDETSINFNHVGYSAVHDLLTGLSTIYIDTKNIDVYERLLNKAFEFDYYNFICRCRKDKIKKINEFDS